ncbi:hypothetical protein [Caryophanon latum]|nr:hypothetical protein [Caryophanon latum]
MWVITVFEDNYNVRMFEYAEKNEATQALKAMNETAILSYTK